jgi:hypothetical protein
LYSVFGRVEHTISVLRLYFCLINVLFTFLSSHWEKYNTGVLFLPWGYDVSQLVNHHAISSLCSVKTIRSLTQNMIWPNPVHVDHLFGYIFCWLRVLEIHIARWHHRRSVFRINDVGWISAN